jgi:hypothetical protein
LTMKGTRILRVRLTGKSGHAEHQKETENFQYSAARPLRGVHERLLGYLSLRKSMNGCSAYC